MNKLNTKAILLFSACIAIIPFFLALSNKTSYYIDVMVFVAINSIVASGLSLLLGYAGQISLGHAAFYGIGAYSSGILTTKCHVSPWIAIAAGILVAIVFAYIIAVPALRLQGHYLAMATLGFGMIVYIVFNEFIALTGGPSGFGEIPRLNAFGICLDSTMKYYYFSWLVAMVILIISLNIVDSRPGRALRAIHDSEVAAQACGINTAKAKVNIFVLSAVYGSIAGSLYCHFVTFVNPPPFSIFFSLKLLMMVIIGGIGSVWGAFIGAAVLTFLPEWLTFLEDFDVLAYGLILLVIVIFLPQGLAGLFRKLIRS